MTLGTVTVTLRQCSGCGWWTRWLTVRGRCGDCVRGWRTSVAHGHLEHATTRRRITVKEVVDAIPDVRGNP